jgi:hypothetical protein
MNTTISRPAPPGAAAAQPAPQLTAWHGRAGSAAAWKRTLAVIAAAGTVAAATLSLGMALAPAAAATPTAIEDPHGQLARRTALDQSEPGTTLARHRALGALGLQEPVAQPKAPSQSKRDTTLARHRALGALAAQPAATTRPAAPAPGPGVDVVATLLVGLVGGLVGGALVVLVAMRRPGRLRVRGTA